MARRKGRSRRSRIYWRNGRAYVDVRDYADVGGGRESLVPRGEKRATTDRDVAERLAAERVAELERLRRSRGLTGATGAALGGFAAHHLVEKARAGRVSHRHLEDVEQRLRRWVDHLGADRPLDAVGVRDVEAFLALLAAEGLSGSTRRHYLNALSNLYRRAQGEGVVVPGTNPAAAVLEKPRPRRVESRWLEVPEAALLLESARTCRPRKAHAATPGIHAILATFLLTGGRKREVLGLDVEDVSFDRRTVTFRPNAHRGLKTDTSRRVVPLWPQLEAILRAWVFERAEPHPGGLLFVGRDGGMVGDLDKQLDLVAGRAGWRVGEIRSRMFRHSYCAARLQTIDRGEPVSPYTVAKELGHGGLALVNRVYGHLGTVRHRAEVVEYRVEQHTGALGERLAAVRTDAS